MRQYTISQNLSVPIIPNGEKLTDPDPEGVRTGGADPQWQPTGGRGIQEQSPGGGPGAAPS